MPARSVHLISAADEILAAEAVRKAVDELVGNADRAEVLHEFSGEEYTVEDLVIAASTPPMLSEFRVVVGRNMSRFGAAQLGPLIRWLDDPAPTTDLVLEWDSGRPSRKLVSAAEAAGAVVTAAGVPRGARNQRNWVTERLAESPVSLDAAAQAAIADHLGEELNRLGGVLATLEAVHGSDARLGVDDITPYLGAEGDVPSWDLTDAIDRGEVRTALATLQRMWSAGRHPLEVMAILTNHITRIARLDGAPTGPGADAVAEAAKLLGLKGSTFPARKALDACRRRGSDGVARAMELLAEADLDLRGRSGLEGRYVTEILSARLAATAR